MAWNTDATQQRLRDAAAAEFAASGYSGATMSGIAARAGINKERLYKYFGDKRALWSAVVTDELERLAAAVELTEESLHDIGQVAADLFDYHVAHPELSRLLQWEELTPELQAADPDRGAHYRQKVQVMAHAQKRNIIEPSLDPGHLLFALIALAAWWQTAPQLARMVTGRAPNARERAQRRKFVVEAARRLAQPGGEMTQPT